LGWSPSTPEGGIDAEVVALDAFSTGALPARAALQGRIALLPDGDPPADSAMVALPAAQVGRDDAESIRRSLARGVVRMSLELINRITPGAAIVNNVIAGISGRD